MNPDRSGVRASYKAAILSTLVLSACAMLLPGRCVADEVSVSITNPSQTATPGETVVFTGTVSNFLEESLSSSGVTFTFPSHSSDLTVTQLLGPADFSIGAGDTSPIVNLFSVTLDSTIGPGTYPVGFDYLATGEDDEMRGGAGTVSVIVTPEPSTIWLMASGLIILATMRPRLIPKKSK